MATNEELEIKIKELEAEVRRLNRVIEDALIPAFTNSTVTQRAILDLLRKTMPGNSSSNQ